MESLQENRIFIQRVEEMRKGIDNCKHVFMRVRETSDETEMRFRCLKKCGCDNTKVTYQAYHLFAMLLLNNSGIFSEMVEEISEMSPEEYSNKINAYVEKRLGRCIELPKDEKIIMELTSEFYEKSYDFLLNEYYSRLFGFDKNLINNPNLTEEEIIGLFNLLSEKDILTTEEIVRCINKAIPDKIAGLIRRKEGK